MYQNGFYIIPTIGVISINVAPSNNIQTKIHLPLFDVKAQNAINLLALCRFRDGTDLMWFSVGKQFLEKKNPFKQISKGSLHKCAGLRYSNILCDGWPADDQKN